MKKDSNNKDSWLIEQWRIKQQLTHICKIYKEHYHTSADLSFPLSWECTEVWMGLLQARCWTDLNECVHVSMRMLLTLALPLNLAVWQLWYNAPQTVYSNNEFIFIFYKKVFSLWKWEDSAKIETECWSEVSLVLTRDWVAQDTCVRLWFSAFLSSAI